MKLTITNKKHQKNDKKTIILSYLNNKKQKNQSKINYLNKLLTNRLFNRLSENYSFKKEIILLITSLENLNEQTSYMIDKLKDYDYNIVKIFAESLDNDEESFLKIQFFESLFFLIKEEYPIILIYEQFRMWEEKITDNKQKEEETLKILCLPA